MLPNSTSTLISILQRTVLPHVGPTSGFRAVPPGSGGVLCTRNSVLNEGLGSKLMCPLGLQIPCSVDGGEATQGVEQSPVGCSAQG